jgi:hypothetical protein
MQGSGGLLTEYSFDVCRGPGDFRLNIHSVYTGFRQITDRIFSWGMQGSGGLLTKYSFGVCRGLADCQLNIQLVCAGIRRITDQIFIDCTRIEYLVVGTIGLGGLELTIPYSE